MPSNLDALATAIMTYEGLRPNTPSYRNCNPGNLRDRATGKFRVFPDFITGYSALLADLKDKCTGKSASGLQPTSSLLDLFKVYAPSSDHNQPATYASFVALWISKTSGKPFTIDSQLKEIYAVQ